MNQPLRESEDRTALRQSKSYGTGFGSAVSVSVGVGFGVFVAGEEIVSVDACDVLRGEACGYPFEYRVDLVKVERLRGSLRFGWRVLSRFNGFGLVGESTFDPLDDDRHGPKRRVETIDGARRDLSSCFVGSDG